MLVDFAVTYSFVHSEARSWSIPFEDPYEEAAQQLFEQAPHSPEYVPRDHVPVFITELEHPEDLVSAEGTPPLLPISTPSTSCRAGIPEANTPPQNRPLLATPRPGCEVGESSAAAARRQGPAMAHGVYCSYMETRLQDTERRMMAALELVNRRVNYQVDVCTRESSEFCTRHHDTQKDRAAVRAEIEVLRNKRLAYEQEVLETQACRLEWQRQAADDFAIEHIMHTQALEAGAHIDILEDTGKINAECYRARYRKESDGMQHFEDWIRRNLGERFMPLEEVHIDDMLQFMEEPVEIMEREIKRLKRSRIPLVKVHWNSRRGPEFTWEREDSFKKKYPHLFTNMTSSSTTRS
nr:putative reverse transcriptase domain-containing protein [Tanacetum cinerariifolium]